VGEEVIVVKKDGDWWTGVIGSRTGIFPANYVQAPDNNQPSATNGAEPGSDFNDMNINGSAQDQTSNMSAEEARNQADADSEVSQINTQNVSNDANMQEFRGMTASAVRRLEEFLWANEDDLWFCRVCERRREKWRRSSRRMKPRAVSSCRYRRASW
jgi:uncharacterized protein YqfA (UPF0365 family)